MKKIICFLVMFVCLFSFALADYTPSYSNDDNKREYKYDASGFYPRLVIQDEDLDESVLCLTIREIIKDELNFGQETIVEISLDKESILHIILDWSSEAIPQYAENYDVARINFSSITDSILSYEELDPYWDKIQYEYPNGKAVFSKDMILDSEYGRYFDGKYVDELIK